MQASCLLLTAPRAPACPGMRPVCQHETPMDSSCHLAGPRSIESPQALDTASAHYFKNDCQPSMTTSGGVDVLCQLGRDSTRCFHSLADFRSDNGS